MKTDEHHYYYNIFQKNVQINYLKIMINKCLMVITLRFGQTKIVKGNFNAAKKPLNIWEINVHIIVEAKTNYKY